jgi:hypothetical protein
MDQVVIAILGDEKVGKESFACQVSGPIAIFSNMNDGENSLHWTSWSVSGELSQFDLSRETQ